LLWIKLILKQHAEIVLTEAVSVSGIKVAWVLLAPRAPLDPPEQEASQVPKVSKALRDRKEPKVLQVLLV